MKHLFHRLPGALLLGLVAVAWSAGPARAQTTPAQPAAKPAAKPPAKPAPKPAAPPNAKVAARPAAPPRPATPRQQLRSEAQGLALATETVEIISAGQLDVAARVLTGAADCEFKQTVTVLPVDGRPGWFSVSHQGKRYRMLPRETATGAVRLEDPAAGVVWLQIPAKSMLMNAKLGQRMVDSCLHAEQRAAVNAVQEAGHSIGIVAAPAEAAASR